MHGKEIQVKLKPDKAPRKQLDYTMDYYEARSRDLAMEVDKLCKVVKLAHKNRHQIHWDRYKWLFAFQNWQLMSVDFIEEALTSGLAISKVY